MYTKKNKLLLILILISGIVARLLFINQMPPGLHFDEARDGLDAIKIINGEYQHVFFRPVLFGGDEGSREALYANLLSLFVKTFGNTEISIRLTSTFISIVNLFLFLILANVFFKKDEKSKIYALLIFTFSSVILIVSRAGFRVNLLHTAVILNLIFFFLLLKKPTKLNFSLFGASLGLGFYTYNAYPIIFVFFAVISLMLKKNNKNLVMTIFFLLLTLFPFFVFFRNKNNFIKYTARADELSVVNPIWTHNSQKEQIRALAKNSFLNLQGLVAVGDKNRRHNAYKLPAIDFPLNIVFVLSLVTGFLKIYKDKLKPIELIKKYQIESVLFGGLLWSLLPAIVTFQGSPHFVRGFALFVFTPLIIPFLIKFLNPCLAGRQVKPYTINLFILVFAIFSITKVFYLWGQKSNLLEVFGGTQYLIANDIKNYPNKKIYVLSEGVKDMTIDYLNYKNPNIEFHSRIGFEDKLFNLDKDGNLKKSLLYADANSYLLDYMKDKIETIKKNDSCISQVINNSFYRFECL